MDADFFCLNSHLATAGPLLRHLNDLVDPTIALQVLNPEVEGRVNRHEIGQRYTKLLHASIPPERELSIEAVTRTELFGNRIYLRIYWPMLVEGFYHYPPYGDLVEGLYWKSVERQFHAQGRGLERFFPALAIRDRMVLVPKGQNETLEGMGINEPAPPPLQRGVIEVDFDDADDLERACLEVGAELRNELRHELLAYQSYQLADQTEFDTVSALLGVPPALLRRAVREETDAKELIFKQLTCTLRPTTVTTDVQTRMSLRIDNASDVDLGELRVQIRGPSTGMEINPERIALTIGPKASVGADFSVATTRPGEFVVEILFLAADADVPRDMLPVQQIWITSVRA